jgi:hypothetical protein
MVNRSEEFFKWAESIGRLDEYEDLLDISVDYAGDQDRRLKASNTLFEMDKAFIEYIKTK